MSALFDMGSAAEFNAIAAKVMAHHGIPVCDLHAFVMSEFGEKEPHPHVSHYVKSMGSPKGKKQGRGKVKSKRPAHTPIVEMLSKVL